MRNSGVRWLWLMVATGVVCAASAAPRSRIGPAPPPSQTAYDVQVSWALTGETRWLNVPGRHELTFHCAHAPGKQATVVVCVHAADAEPVPEPQDYRDCSASEVLRLAFRGRAEQVRFADDFGGAVDWPRDVRAELPDGQRVPVAYAFRTVAGLMIIVPNGLPDEELARTALPGDTLHIRGQALPLAGVGPCVVADRVALDDGGSPVQAPPWRLKVRWLGQEVASLDELGRRTVEVPCAHVRGAREQLNVRLREYRVVRIDAGGETIEAELAVTPQQKSYGLQGRAGLRRNAGMLFFFEQPQRPVFTMKHVRFPLSIAFVTEEGLIVNIEHLAPGSRRQVSSPAPVRYVLEMEEGWFGRHGLRAGSRIGIP